jgi:2-polyprenyl-6-methoxyphenol hydroxylase-like FAD-dependent oxidoreductase
MTNDPVQQPLVIIVGAGPVGLTLAIELGWRGVPALVFDEGDGVPIYPTNNQANARTMEFMRRWGIADKARYECFPIEWGNDVCFVTGFLGYELCRFPHAFEWELVDGVPTPTEATPEPMIWCPKLWYDVILRDHAMSYPTNEIRYGWRVQSFRQDASGVTVEAVDLKSGRSDRVRARYLAACDGASSAIRRALGIQLQGAFAEGYNASIYARIPALKELLPFKTATQYHTLDNGARANLSAMDGKTHWRINVRIRADEVDTFDPLRAVYQTLPAEIPVEIINWRPWAGHSVVADRYQDGRVFLVGDAAHLNWPMGGFGMNTGQADAVDLGWKLAAVREGWGGEYLLASYGPERRPIAERNVRESQDTVKKDYALVAPPGLTDPTAEGERIRREVGRHIWETQNKHFYTMGIQLGYCYEDSPICVPDGTPPPPDEIGKRQRYLPSARPGARAPHAWLPDGRSTLDLFGHGFVLLRFGGDEADTRGIARAAADRRVPFRVVDIADRKIRDLYERRFVLVRPDGHVAWRSDAPPDDAGALIDRVRGAMRPD